MHTGPLIDLSDEADLLSKWQERVGVEQSPFGVLPTDQTLESSDSPGSKLDNRERLHLIVGDWQTGSDVPYRVAECLDRLGLSHPCRATRSHRGVESTRGLRPGESDYPASRMNLSKRPNRIWSIHVRQVVVNDHDVRPLLLSDFEALHGG